MLGIVKRVAIVSLVLLASGCASLPDVNRIQGNMDKMVHYMGIMSTTMPAMVYNTGRMADTAERMQRKSDGMLADLQKKGGTAEKAIQNYSQAFLDNDRAVIKGLQGIKEELSEVRQSIKHTDTTQDAREQARAASALQAKMNALEAKLSALSDKVDKLDRKSP